MHPRYDPNPPRHARLFELLRQTEQAAATVERLEFMDAYDDNPRVVEHIRETAVSSLRSAVA